MKNKILKNLVTSMLTVSVAVTPIVSLAAGGDSPADRMSGIEELSGISIEQMQNDFLNQQFGELSEAGNAEGANCFRRQKTESDSFIYLSDQIYDSSSKAGWGSIQTDKNVEGNTISLHINGTKTLFEKGMGAHATSYIIYNVTEWKDVYTRLSAYAGVDSTKVGKSDGVSFHIWGSETGTGNWVSLESSERIRPEDNAWYFDLDISAYSFLKLEARVEGNNFSDHAVYGDLRLLKTDYDINTEYYSGIKTVSEYDKELSVRSIEENYDNHKITVLKREFVDRIGYQNIQTLYKYHPWETGATLDWILGDEETLQLFIEAGEYFSGSGYNALQALISLYTNHSGDVSDPVYKKMLLATAAAYSKENRTFLVNYGGTCEVSDAVEKYERMKQLYDEGRFVREDEFEEYPMELVRTVMDTKINNSEILWLRDYIDKKYPTLNDWRRFNGYGYASYKHPDYGRSEYYSDEMKGVWDDKYGFSGYGISYGEKNLFRIWMLMENGAICWGLAGLGIVVNEVQGIAALGTYQPGHEAFLTYSTNKDGKGIWSISDDIAGWGSSFTRWGSTTGTEYRIPLEWGVKEYNVLNSGNNTSYLLLAQDALNDYDDYVDSMLYNFIANSYPAGGELHEAALNKSLEHYSKNLDSLYGMYLSMCQDDTTTDQEWSQLAKRVIGEYTYFPAPMVDLLKLIRQQIDSEVLKIETDMWQTDALHLAANATENESLQDKACRQVANSILGKSVKELASFSFDGENANQIVIDESYASSTIQVRISLDGGKNWETFEDGNPFTTEHKIPLSAEQINRINAEDDILVGLMGIETNYRIDIKAGEEISSSIFFNDKENRLLGNGIEQLEYSVDGGTVWQDYVTEGKAQRISGDVKAMFRTKAHGTVMLGKEKEFIFTESNDPDTRKYIYIDNLSLHSFSSQVNSDKAEYIIDGNDNTGWHTNTAAEPAEGARTVVVKLDQVRYISALEYMSAYNNGKLKRGTVYTSLDGNEWTKILETEVFPNNNSIKKIEFPESVGALYVKLEGTETYGSSLNTFFTCRTLDFYEDTTKQFSTEPTLEYSVTEPTRENVIVTMQLPEGCSAQETEYTFTENGTYTFTYTDVYGTEKTIVAEVNWIDNEAPKGELVYSTKEYTSGSVTVTLEKLSEPVVFLDGSDGTHTFIENGTYTFIIRDAAGNETEYEANVSWIGVPEEMDKEEEVTEEETPDVVIPQLPEDDGEPIEKQDDTSNVATYSTSEQVSEKVSKTEQEIKDNIVVEDPQIENQIEKENVIETQNQIEKQKKTEGNGTGIKTEEKNMDREGRPVLAVVLFVLAISGISGSVFAFFRSRR